MFKFDYLLTAWHAWIDLFKFKCTIDLLKTKTKIQPKTGRNPSSPNPKQKQALKDNNKKTNKRKENKL